MLLGNRYEMREISARDYVGALYHGWDTQGKRSVAIKVLREDHSRDPEFVQRFQQAAKAASGLQHPNIVQVFEYGQSDDLFFIVMEPVEEGSDLRRLLRLRGVLDVDRALAIAHDVALSLGAAHQQGIIHGDVKPQSIMIAGDGSVKLVFSITSVDTRIDGERASAPGMTLGTIQYFSPERAKGEEALGPASDVYALGCVLYEMLTGRTPFDGDTPVAVAMQHIQNAPMLPSRRNPAISPALDALILRCLQKEPGARFPDGVFLAEALEIVV